MVTKEAHEGGDEGKVITPGKSADSKLYKLILLPKDDDKKMPPVGEPLAKAVADRVKAWIDEGAKWPEGVVLKVPKEEGPKVVADDPGLPISRQEGRRREARKSRRLCHAPRAEHQLCTGVDFTHRGKEVKDDELILLKDMPNLVELNLGGMNITDANLVHIKPLVNLVRLQLHRTKITDAGLANLAGLTKLVSLNLYDTQVTDAGIQQLKGCKALKRLYVWQTKVKKDGAKQLAAAIAGIDINRGYELPPEPKKEEPKKEEPKKNPKKDKAKKDPKKDPAAKVNPKKDDPRKMTPRRRMNRKRTRQRRTTRIRSNLGIVSNGPYFRSANCSK